MPNDDSSATIEEFLELARQRSKPQVHFTTRTRVRPGEITEFEGRLCINPEDCESFKAGLIDAGWLPVEH